MHVLLKSCSVHESNGNTETAVITVLNVCWLNNILVVELYSVSMIMLSFNLQQFYDSFPEIDALLT